MNRTPLPWDDPNARPLDDLLAVLDRAIAETDNPLLRERLERFARPWREAGDKR